MTAFIEKVLIEKEEKKKPCARGKILEAVPCWRKEAAKGGNW